MTKSEFRLVIQHYWNGFDSYWIGINYFGLLLHEENVISDLVKFIEHHQTVNG